MNILTQKFYEKKKRRLAADAHPRWSFIHQQSRNTKKCFLISGKHQRNGLLMWARSDVDPKVITFTAHDTKLFKVRLDDRIQSTVGRIGRNSWCAN